MVYKRTKIVATLGPASSSPAVIKALIKAGLNVVRLNFSHGTHEERREQIQNIRKISRELNRPVAIMADLQGPKLRLGSFEGVIKIKKGQIITLSTNPRNNSIPVQFDLSPYVSKDERIFIDDGLMEFKVIGVSNKTIQIKASNSGHLTQNKGINVPDTTMKNSAFTSKDKIDLEFVLKQDVDYIALSFIQTADDLKIPREIINKYKSPVKIVAKIEKKLAVANLQEIMKATDAVMVARGDLGVEMRACEVPLAQHKIIDLARQFQKPVIVATQMLESMVHNPRPTRAETSDVAHAVLSQVDAVMLSAETASGKYPVEAVKTMNEIILSVEGQKEYKNVIKINWQNIPEKLVSINAIVSAATALENRINAKTVVVATATGDTARILASFRPEAKIVAVTYNETVNNQLQLVWGIESLVTGYTRSYDVFWKQIIQVIHTNKVAKAGDKVIIISGSLVGMSGKTDTIKVVTI